MNLDPATTKYLIEAKLTADGIVEKPDVVGAIFGQTEGLLGDELDLRDLQKTGRMGRIEVEITSKKGKSEGSVLIPSSLDQVETAILAAALETIDRIGPCRAKITVDKIDDVRIKKKQKIVDRAKELLGTLMDQSKLSGMGLTDSVRQAVQVDEVIHYGEDKCSAGPNVDSSDAIIVVEGRSDVINLLKYGIKNTVAVGGTNVPKTIQKLSTERVVTAFVDGDRGGDLILKELSQVAEIDFIAKAPKALEVEELTQKQIIKALRNKVPFDQYMEMHNLIVDNHTRPNNKNTNIDRTPPKTGIVPKPGDRPRKDEKPGKDVDVRKAPKAKVIKATSGKPKTEADLMTPEIARYKGILKNLSGTLRAMLINKKGEVVQEIAVRQLADTLKTTPPGICAVVFDGIISQRLLDIAAEQKIEFLVGSKKGNLTKEPDGVLVLSKGDLNL
ncbi:MAG: DNA primase DnaG [Candidatus Thermoplasmatota archaeon]|nr:DNA primase DnaG [Candidatus Thermoplasmatota archaeon]